MSILKMKRVWAVLLSLSAAAAATAQTNYVVLDGHRVHPTRILAKYAAPVRTANQTSVASSFGLKELRKFSRMPGLTIFEDQSAPKGNRMTVSEAEVETYRQQLEDRIARMRISGLFEYVEPDYIVSAYLTPNDAAFLNGSLWGLRNLGQFRGTAGADIDAVRAWDVTTGSTNVVVAVIDTGIRYTHRDLEAQMWVNPGEIPDNDTDDDGNGVVDDVYGLNAVIDTGDPMDDNFHGTHVAGTIGAAANDGNPHVGVAWKVQLMACKFLGAEGFGSTSDAIECIDYAVSMGAKILNNSWGGGGFSSALYESIENAQQNDVLFVAAAGNAANNNDLDPAYPASYTLDNIISVAALDRNDNLADFSNYGATSVDVGAPGVAIFSTMTASDQDYGLLDGTSMASPHVAGVAALIAAAYPGAPLTELRDRILFSVVPLNALEGKATTGGRVNAYKALTITGGPNLTQTVTPPSGSTILSSSTTTIYVEVTSLFGVRDATVVGTFSGLTNLTRTFANNGVPPDAAVDAVYTVNLPALNATGELTLTLVATATNKIPSTNTVVYTVIPRPANDDFAAATKVASPGGTFLSNNRFGTLETGEPVHAGVTSAKASLWWAWTADADGDVLVDTTGSAIDTVLGVYRGTSVSALTHVASANDVAGFPQAYLTFAATKGQTYRIAVAGADAEAIGSIRLRIAPGGRLDEQPPAVFITSPVSGTVVATNEVVVSGWAVDPQPNSSGLREVLVRMNDGLAFPANGTTNWSARVRLDRGLNVITVRADDNAGHSSALVQAQVTYMPQDPANDLFNNAIQLAGVAGQTSASTTNATKEAGEPAHAGNSGGKSVWWSFRAPEDGALALSTTNSTFDTLLGVYTGTRVDALTEVAANDDARDGVRFSQVTVAVRSNETYRIAVDGFDGTVGVARLSHQFTPSGVVHLTVGSSAGGSVTPGSGDVPAGATVVLRATPEAGYVFTGWTGGAVSTDNPLSLVVNSDLTVNAEFTLRTFSDGFETGNFSALPWSSTGAAWTVQTNHVALGRYAARSGAISDGGSSTLVLVKETPAGFGSFDFKVSSEPAWDALEFLVNGVSQGRWSGEVGWQTHVFQLPAGTNRLEWKFSKDFNVSQGLDAAFVDNVDLPVYATQMIVTRTSTDARLIRLQAQPNYSYVIEASTDLKQWQPISTNLAVGGLIQISDPEAANHTHRFYRAVGR